MELRCNYLPVTVLKWYDLQPSQIPDLSREIKIINQSRNFRNRLFVEVK